MHSRLISRLGLIGYSYALMFRGEFFRDVLYKIFELCDRLLLNNKIERKRCKRCPASFLQRKYVCQRECMFDIFLIYIGNYDSMLP